VTLAAAVLDAVTLAGLPEMAPSYAVPTIAAGITTGAATIV